VTRDAPDLPITLRIEYCIPQGVLWYLLKQILDTVAEHLELPKVEIDVFQKPKGHSD
jgi:hypothetical protein